MKIQLDLDNKIIKVEEQKKVNLGELMDVLDELLPNDLWREFKLEITTITKWNDPFPFQPYRPTPAFPIPNSPFPSLPNPYPHFPTYDPPWIVTCGSDSKLNAGTYNVEVK